MRAYYEQSGVTIYCADCREVLPSLCSASLLLTDPPYGIGADQNLRANKQHGRAVAPSRDYGVGNWDTQPVPAWLLQQAIELSKQAIVWGGNYYDLPPASCWLVWDKDNGDNGYADCELAWTNLPQAVRKFRWRWMGMLQEEAGVRKELREHPTQKPEPLMIWSIQQATFARETALILDPFMGSGTTLVAAKRLGYHAIGIERQEQYCEVAANRLRQEALPLEVA